jgi:hypothetical protein
VVMPQMPRSSPFDKVLIRNGWIESSPRLLSSESGPGLTVTFQKNDELRLSVKVPYLTVGTHLMV